MLHSWGRCLSLVEAMHGHGGVVLGVHGSAVMGTHVITTTGGIGSNVLARFAEVVRAGIGVGASLVRGYLAGAIGTSLIIKIERGFVIKC